MRKLYFAPLLILALAVTALAADSVIEEIVCRVNGSIITRSDFDKAKQQIESEAREKNENAQDELSKRQSDVLRDLIDQQLLIQKAGDLGITGDTELVKKLDDMRKQMGLETMEDLQKAAEQQGISYEDFKQNLRNSIITQSVIGREVGSHIQITQEEMKQFYDEHKSELERPEQVTLSEILIAPVKPAKEGDKVPDATPEQLSAAEQKANEVLAELKKGGKFDDLAKKYSDGPTAQQGGDLGDFRRGMLAKELEDKTFNLKAGEYTDVIRTKQGFVILQVTTHSPAGVPPLKDVENNVQEAIYLKKLQPALRSYLTKLREDAFIDIKEGYTDSAASPNETKPVYMAADSPSQGKPAKKKKKKFLVF
jgi:peptidyl-prolyl cis-trans isomerase SurA